MSSSPLHVLHVASEHAGLLHTGGLGEVVEALSEAQAALGVRVDVVLPTSAERARSMGAQHVGDLSVRMPWGAVAFERHDVMRHGVRWILLTAEGWFDRGFLYGPPGASYGDNGVRFAAMCRAAVAVARAEQPDVVHAHDWHAGWVPPLICTDRVRPRTVFTVHNPMHQGELDEGAWPVTGLGLSHVRFDGIAHEGRINALKAGVQYADRVTTVSPTHAAELCTPEGGFGLHQTFAWRRGDLTGILNGIAQDPVAPVAERPARRAALCEVFGVSEPTGPLFGYVGRLTDQKGLDLVADAVPRLVASGGALVLLGTGDPGLSGRLAHLAAAHPGVVAFRDAFDSALAARMFEALDVVLVPSRYEPCGLVQMHAMRHGALPLVRHVGGLADTVTDVQDGGWGLVFQEATGEALAEAIERAVALFARPRAWGDARARAMAQDHSWQHPAGRYVALYQPPRAPEG